MIPLSCSPRRARRLALGALLAALAVPAAASANGVVTEFPVPTANAGPYALTAGPDGNVWFTEHDAGARGIGRITPSGAITEFPVEPGATGAGIALGSDGNLWYTDDFHGVLGRITPTGTFTAFAAPFDGRPLNTPRGIATGPDGDLYIVDAGNNRIVEVRTDGTTATSFPIPTAAANAQQITRGPDGNMWFTENNNDLVGRVNLNVTPHTISEFPTGTMTGALGIAAGADGKIYFSQAGGGANEDIGHVDVTGANYGVSDVLAGGASDPEGMTSARDGALWFAIFNGSQIGRLVPGTTAIQQFSTGITANAGPRFTAAGPDGNVWFSEETGNAIGRITVDAPVTRQLPPPPPPITTTPPPATATKPAVTHLAVAPARLVRGRRAVASFQLSKAATVTLAFRQGVAGRRGRGGSCVKPTAANKRAKRCTRTVTIATVRRAAAKGTVRISFGSKISGHALALGHYRIVVTPAGGSAVSSKLLTLVAPRRARRG